MKALILLLIPMMVFSKAQDTLPPEIEVIKQEIISERKSIDSLKDIKSVELKKYKKLENLLRQKVLELINSKAKPSDNKTKPIIIKNNALRNESYEQFHLSDAQKIELVPDIEGYTILIKKRKWTGRLFSKFDHKIKLVKNEE